MSNNCPQVIQDFINQLWCQHNLNCIDTCCTDTCCVRLWNGETLHNRADFKNYAEILFSSLSNCNRKILDCVSEPCNGGFKVVLRTQTTATFNGEFQGVEGRGEQIEFCDFTQFVCSPEGHISELWQGSGLYSALFCCVTEREKV